MDTVHGKEARTYSPLGACGSCLARTVGRKRIDEGADGNSSGADAITTGAYAHTADADVTAGAD